jgi:hypothetical protein
VQTVNLPYADEVQHTILFPGERIWHGLEIAHNFVYDVFFEHDSPRKPDVPGFPLFCAAQYCLFMCVYV